MAVALQGREVVRLPEGPIEYVDRGEGEALLFLHGALVNAELWRKVVGQLEGGFRCIAPDLPLGSHRAPMSPDADLSPPGLADLVADFVEALGLERVTLVGNDTGGALAQLVATRHPDRVARLVLTDCDAFDNFPPRFFNFLRYAAYVPGVIPVLYQPMRLRAPRRLPISFGWLAKRPIDDAAMDSYVRPVLESRAVRRDVKKVLRALDSRYTMEAAGKLKSFERPALIVWSVEDRFFPFEHAKRLARILPNSRLESVSDSYTFVPEDQPERLAALVKEFMAE